MGTFPKKVENWSPRFTYGLICLVSLVFMIWKGKSFGFWTDEFAQIVYSGMGKTLLESFLVIDPTPPLFNVLANIWYNLVPWGERWLLLLPQLAMVAGIYVSALWAERLGGARLGVWTAVLLAFSRMVITHCGFEFRAYGVYLLAASLAFYSHSRVMDAGNEKVGRWGIVYWLSLLLLVYSHCLAFLIFFALAFYDIVLILRRRIPWTRLFIYFFSGILFLPWVIWIVYAYIVSKLSVSSDPSAAFSIASWMPRPGIMDIPDLCSYLCGNHILVLLFFVCGGLFVLKKIADAVKVRVFDVELEQLLIPCWAAAFMILVMFVYGQNRSGFPTLWVARYFTGLFPCFAVVCALGIETISAFAEKRSPTALKAMSVLFFVAIVGVHLGNVLADNISEGNLSHREATEVMYQQPDIHDEDTLVMTSMKSFLEGWEEYYCRKQGQREGIGLRSAHDVTEEELLSHDVVYFEYAYGYGSADREQLTICQLLESKYSLDEEWSDVCLRRYVRK